MADAATLRIVLTDEPGASPQRPGARPGEPTSGPEQGKVIPPPPGEGDRPQPAGVPALRGPTATEGFRELALSIGLGPQVAVITNITRLLGRAAEGLQPPQAPGRALIPASPRGAPVPVVLPPAALPTRQPVPVIPAGVAAGVASRGVASGGRVAVPAAAGASVLGPVALGAAAAAVALGGLALGARSVVRGFDRLANRTAEVSPGIALAQSGEQIAALQRRFRTSERLGPELADLVRVQTRTSDALAEILLPIQDAVLNILVPILQGGAAVLEIVAAFVKKFDQLFDLLKTALLSTNQIMVPLRLVLSFIQANIDRIRAWLGLPLPGAAKPPGAAALDELFKGLLNKGLGNQPGDDPTKAPVPAF